MLDAYLNNIQASPPTIILAKDMYRVHHVTKLLWDCNFHATYYHEGHTQDQLVEAIDSFFSQQIPILVLSLQTDSIQYFVGSAQQVLVLHFPGSIDSFQDWKSLVKLQDKYGHITSFISDPDLHLLTELQSYFITKYETVPSGLTDKLSHVLIAVVFTPDSHVHQAPNLTLTKCHQACRPRYSLVTPNILPQGVIPQESVYRSDLQIDDGDPGRSSRQVDSPPVFAPQSGNCSGNGDNVPTPCQDEYLGTQTDVWVLAENINDYDYDDNHSQPFLGDGGTHCCDNGFEYCYCPDPMLSDPLHGALDNPPGHPPISGEPAHRGWSS